jgi:hypothetical protein
MGNNVVIGVDFGTDSVRALVVDTQGAVAASAVAPYPRWKKGLYCDPARNLFRQHPLDYTEGLTTAVTRALEKAGVAVAGRVRGLSIDTTGSTPTAVDQTGTPLSLLPEFQDDPDGMFILWKDHTGVAEAEEINAACAARPEDDYVNIPAASTRPNGSGPKSCIPCAPMRKFEHMPFPGWNIATGSPDSSAGTPIRSPSSAAVVPPATRPCGTPPGADCRAKDFFRASTLCWPQCATGCLPKPSPATGPWAPFRQNGLNVWACPPTRS